MAARSKSSSLEDRACETAVLNERNRIARDIHDTLAQGFAAIRLQLELARGEPGLPPNTARAIELAYQIAAENLVETRRALALLKSTQLSLSDSLTAAVDRVRRLSQAEVIAALDRIPSPPSGVTHELMRITEEAMRNAARHAEARTIRVSLAPGPDGGLRIAIIDDGKGFDPAYASQGYGLAGLRERAAAIKAELEIHSAPGAGTTVTVAWAPQVTQTQTLQVFRPSVAAAPRGRTVRATTRVVARLWVQLMRVKKITRPSLGVIALTTDQNYSV
jgi:signal transduction histidine kinase